jgi:hypothetical protein
MNEKIHEVCYYNSLCNGNNTETLKYIRNISAPTVKKYITIGENLDYELKDQLDKKGKDKLSIGLALKFCELPNKEHQYYIYQKISQVHLTNKEKISSFVNFLECSICCDNSYYQEKLPCCGHILCMKCLYETIDTMVNDISFSGCKCPFCNSYFPKNYMYGLLSFSINVKENQWMKKNTLIYSKRNYYRNIWRKMMGIIEQVEIMKSKMIGPSLDFKGLVSGDKKEKYYGVCNECSPPVLSVTQIFTNIKVNVIDKECVDGEGNIVILNDNMFHCENCGDKDNECKKCPHCGIKSLRPDACNYVICGDHRWCWICNERLPNDHNGHNVHYWTGPGSSPYSNHCRKSINHHGPDFIMDYCYCGSCSPNSGLKLCRNLECYNRCDNSVDILCNKCK